MNTKGTTLLETVLYIGIFMIILPTYVLFLVQLWQSHASLDARSRMEQTAAMVFLELQNSLTEADAINVSTSAFANDDGVLKFLDGAGQLVTIDRPAVLIILPTANQTVHRLRMQRGTGTAEYLTDPEIDVTQWRIEPVRAGTTLTGLRVSYDTAMLNPLAGVYRRSAFTADTTLSLSGHTTEN
ncbi:MAG: hypothetical protein WC802_00140 [Patescibacteria group bacterium]|jgi:hypothetical protein